MIKIELSTEQVNSLLQLIDMRLRLVALLTPVQPFRLSI